MSKHCFLIAGLILNLACNNTTDVFKKYANATKPVKLGIGTLSMDSIQWNNVFVHKTNELYFTKMGDSASVVHKMDYTDGKFERLQAIKFPDTDPHSDRRTKPDGNQMLFSSLMKENSNDTVSDWNIRR